MHSFSLCIASDHLPPNSLLIFEVEIVEANPSTEEVANQSSS